MLTICPNNSNNWFKSKNSITESSRLELRFELRYSCTLHMQCTCSIKRRMCNSCANSVSKSIIVIEYRLSSVQTGVRNAHRNELIWPHASRCDDAIMIDQKRFVAINYPDFPANHSWIYETHGQMSFAFSRAFTAKMHGLETTEIFRHIENPLAAWFMANRFNATGRLYHMVTDAKFKQFPFRAISAVPCPNTSGFNRNY